MGGRFQDGWLRVIWKWNKSICAWECGIGWGGWGKVQVNDGEGVGVVGMGCGGGQGGGVCCLMGVPEGCSCQVNVLQCRGKYINCKSVQLGYCSGREAVFVVVVGGGYLSVFVWVVGSCLAVSGHEVLMSKRLLVILYMVVSLVSALFCSKVGQERAEAKVDPDVSHL